MLVLESSILLAKTFKRKDSTLFLLLHNELNLKITIDKQWIQQVN